jgi:hypothetical protein
MAEDTQRNASAGNGDVAEVIDHVLFEAWGSIVGL